MKRKTKQVILVLILFVMPILLQPINIHAVETEVMIVYPVDNESFTRSANNKTFKGNSTTQGLDSGARYYYIYYWYIDGDEIDSDCGHGRASSDGILIVTDYNIKVNISTYSIGQHDVNLTVCVEGICRSDSNNWSRSSSYLTRTRLIWCVLGSFAAIVACIAVPSIVVKRITKKE